MNKDIDALAASKGEEELERKYKLNAARAVRIYGSNDLRTCYRRAFSRMQEDQINFPHFDPFNDNSGRVAENKGFRPRIYFIDAYQCLRGIEIRLQYNEQRRLMIKTSNENKSGSTTLRRFEQKIDLTLPSIGRIKDIYNNAASKDRATAHSVFKTLQSRFSKHESRRLYPGLEILSFRDKFYTERIVEGYRGESYQVTLEIAHDEMRKTALLKAPAEDDEFEAEIKQITHIKSGIDAKTNPEMLSLSAEDIDRIADMALEQMEEIIFKYGFDARKTSKAAQLLDKSSDLIQTREGFQAACEARDYHLRYHWQQLKREQAVLGRINAGDSILFAVNGMQDLGV